MALLIARVLKVGRIDLERGLVSLLQVGLDVHPVPLDLGGADLTSVNIRQDLILPDADASLLSVSHLVTEKARISRLLLVWTTIYLLIRWILKVKYL